MSVISSIQPVPTLKEQLVREACSMVRRLLASGTRVPPSLVQASERFESALVQNRPVDMMALASTHERLSRLVAPAKPGTLYMLDHNANPRGRWSSLGPIKLVRDLVRVAILCVVIFIALSVLAIADARGEIDLIRLVDSDGNEHHELLVIKVILERVFWLAAAGIGAAFAMLFQLNDQIVSRTYDPDESASYWVKFFLGVVAGFILVAMVPLDATADSGAEALGPPTIALLGGFSASAVYRILTRLVEALESVFSGGAREQAMAAEKAAVVRASEESTQARMAVAGQLVKIQQRLVNGAPVDQANVELQGVVDTLVPSAAADPLPSVTPLDPAPEPVVVSAPAPDRVPVLAVVAEPVPEPVSVAAVSDLAPTVFAPSVDADPAPELVPAPAIATPAQADAAPEDAPAAAEFAEQADENDGAVG